ncbi:MAG: protein O-mannosyl-transferase family [Anaerolineae bacterium]
MKRATTFACFSRLSQFVAGNAGASDTAIAELARSPRLAYWAGWGVVILAAVLYLLTLDTGLRPDELRGGDLITHQYAQVQARPGNAPGYPLYTMGGWVWFRLSSLLFGWALNPVQRLSSYSTLWALCALIVLYQLCLRAARGHWPVATLATLFYAVTYFFWYYSVTTEQYTSAVLQTLLIVWLAWRWEEMLDSNPVKADRMLLWLALLCGTCLANLVTVLLILPPLVWFILERQCSLLRRARLLGQTAGLVVLPVLSYAYVYWRGATHPEWRGQGSWPNATTWFLDFLTTHQGRDELAPGLTLSPLFTDEFPALIWSELTPIVLLGGLVGLCWLGRRRALFLGSTFFLYLVFCWVDRFGNWYQVIMPAYPLLVVGFAAGTSAWLDRLSSLMGTVAVRAALRVLGMLVLIGLVAYRFAVSWPRADQSWRLEDTGLDPGWAILADAPPADAVILAQHDEWLALSYLTVIWGAAPTIRSLPVCQLPAGSNDQLPEVLYLTRLAVAAQPDCLAAWHRYAAGAELIRTQPSPEHGLSASAHVVTWHLGAGLQVIGYETALLPQPLTGRTGQPLSDAPRWRLSLYWRVDVPLRDNYTVSVRPRLAGEPLRTADGQPLIQDHQPVWSSYPTSRWLPGEVVRDDYVFTLPAAFLPDAVHLVVYRVVESEQGEVSFEVVGEIDTALRVEERVEKPFGRIDFLRKTG